MDCVRDHVKLSSTESPPRSVARSMERPGSLWKGAFWTTATRRLYFLHDIFNFKFVLGLPDHGFGIGPVRLR